jgi:excisionase family DNA binding protein
VDNVDSSNGDKRLIGSDEAGALLGVSSKTALRLMQRGEIKGAYRVGRQYRVPQAEVEAYRRANMVQAGRAQSS